MHSVRRGILGWLLAAWLVALSAPGHAQELLELRLSSGPHAPSDAPDVIVHVPRRLDPRAPVHWLIFLHGFNSCTRALVASEPTPCEQGGPVQRGYGLAALHEQAHSNTLLIVPQLAFLARESRAPRFEQPGGFARFVAELRTQLRARPGGERAPASISLLAHSAGYHAAAEILRDDESGAIAVRNVVLFDALYAHWDVFAHWLGAAPDRHLISLHTHASDTTRGNRKLAALASAGRHGAAVPGLTIERVDTPHRAVPERHLLEVLEELFPAR
jgi:hypothetical protein